jgi:hypothetical protein
MMSMKRMLLVMVPLCLLAAGTAFSAGPARMRPCGPPKGFAAFLQKVGLTNAKIVPCETTTVSIDGTDRQGYWCVDPGHHCNDGSGAGKCTTVIDDSGMYSCVCMKSGK